MKAEVTTELTKRKLEKLMRRPSMSELDEDIARENRRNQSALQRETTHVDRQVKIHMTIHRKNSQEFMKVQSEKFSSPNRRNSLGAIPQNKKMSGSFQAVTFYGAQKGSLQSDGVSPTHPATPFYRGEQKRLSGSHPPPSIHGSRKSSLPSNSSYPPPGTPFYTENEWPKQRRRRHSEVTRNRTLEIRQRLYREFNMPEKVRTHRPWSPSAVEYAQQNINRRLSEPFSRPSEGLSDEIKEKLAYIAGEKPRPPAALPQTPTSTNEDGDQKLDANTQAMDAATDIFEPAPPTTEPEGGKVLRQRRRSEVLYKPAVPKLQRRLSETINRTQGHILPPLQEKI